MNRVQTIRGTIDGWHRRDDFYEVAVHVDGAPAEDVSVTVDDGIVTVQAHHDTLEMYRSFSLPEEVRNGWVSARMEDEKLKVRVECSRPGVPRRITVE